MSARASRLSLVGLLSLLTSTIFAPSPLSASAIMTLKGTVFSVLRDQYVVQSGRELFYLEKKALTPDVREQFEKASAHEITVDVPMNAIMRVRKSQGENGKSAR